MKTSKVIFLGAGLPYRGRRPSAIKKGNTKRRTLDWLMHAFDGHDVSFHFIGGYRFEDTVKAYPELSYSINANWEKTGPAGSLLCSPFTEDTEYFISYTDVLYSPKAVELIANEKADIVVGIDKNWRNRYEGRAEQEEKNKAEILSLKNGEIFGLGQSEEDGEVAGLLKISPAAAKVLQTLKNDKNLQKKRIADVIIALKDKGLSVKSVDIGNNWAELNAPQDIARFVLGTKANTLARLSPLVTKSYIGEIICLTIGQWQKNKEQAISEIIEKLGDSLLAVRSSCLFEDTWASANAGAFLSKLNVKTDEKSITEAVKEVIKSYGDDAEGHEILVHKMVKDVKASGVIFTRSLSYGAPYYIINYDDISTDTDTVTGGSGENLKTLVLHHDSQDVPEEAKDILKNLLPAVRELIELAGHDALDIEFAVDKKLNINILQVRPIAVDHSKWRTSDDEIKTVLGNAVEMFKGKQPKAPAVFGDKAFFGVMPDWNPAEIIGTKPRQLALSLYHFLIMDEIWAAQRAEFGYKDVRPQPLLASFAGIPFVDIRGSFSSFIPDTVSDALAEKLVNHYMQRLYENPHLHDKVELQIAFTCLTPDFETSSERLAKAGFSKEEIKELKDALRQITINGMNHYPEDFADIEKLKERYEKIISSEMPLLRKAFVLLEDSKKFGTLSFSHLAREAFVAVTMLKGMVSENIISNQEMTDYLQSLQTVAKNFTDDAFLVAKNKMKWKEFVETYGHLRPGTYEITSPSYAFDPERYLRPAVETAEEAKEEKFEWAEKTKSRIIHCLKELELPEDIEKLDKFMRKAMEGREYAKFYFTRNLSNALKCLAEFGKQYGLSRDEISHIRLADLEALKNGLPVSDIKEWLKTKSRQGQMWHDVAQAIELPPVLFDENDFYAFHYPETQPNFVSSESIISDVVTLADDRDNKPDIAGKIVLIPQADPGYDWLFGYRIGGLVTKYGGANSHMAIRAAERNLPAAIGIGDRLYEQISQAKVVELNAKNRLLKVIS